MQLAHTAVHHRNCPAGHHHRSRQSHQTYSSQDPERSQSGTTTEQPKPRSPSEAVVWGGNLPSARRAVVGSLTALGVSLVSNFGGLTSALAGLGDGQAARQLHIDVLYPVRGFKRCLNSDNGFEFLFPASWLADQRLLYRAAERVQRQNPLDMPSAQSVRRREVAEPVAAYGPAGSTGEQNLSVICAPIRPDFALSSLGTAQEAAQTFLDKNVAPPGSQLQARLLQASERRDGTQVYYTMEFEVQGPPRGPQQGSGFHRHNLSVCAVRRGKLYTLNAQVPQDKWAAAASDMQTAAGSFRVFA